MDQVIIFFGMSVVLSMLGIVVFFIGISYQRLSKKYHETFDKLTRVNMDVKKGHEEVIIEAEKKARDILAQASTKSQSILEASDIFSKEYKKEFQEKLLQVLSRQESEFENLHNSIKTRSEEVLSSVSKDIESVMREEMKKVSALIGQQIDKANADYRNALYANLEKEVDVLVMQVAKEVLKKTLNQEDQKQLIAEALDEAKKNNVL